MSYVYCDDYEDYEPEPTCDACGGLLMALGTLGWMTHYRCRDCGMDCSSESPDAATF